MYENTSRPSEHSYDEESQNQPSESNEILRNYNGDINDNEKYLRFRNSIRITNQPIITETNTNQRDARQGGTHNNRINNRSIDSNRSVDADVDSGLSVSMTGSNNNSNDNSFHNMNAMSSTRSSISSLSKLNENMINAQPRKEVRNDSLVPSSQFNIETETKNPFSFWKSLQEDKNTCTNSPSKSQGNSSPLPYPGSPNPKRLSVDPASMRQDRLPEVHDINFVNSRCVASNDEQTSADFCNNNNQSTSPQLR